MRSTAQRSLFRSYLTLAFCVALVSGCTGPAAAGPNGSPRPGARPIPAPFGLAVIAKQGCAKYGGPLGAPICDAAIQGGDLALSWHDEATTLDGYKVYRVDGGRNDLVATTSNGAAPTFGIVSRPSGGFSGHCYAIAAYIGQRVSAQSPSLCAKTMTFAPTQVYYSFFVSALPESGFNWKTLPSEFRENLKGLSRATNGTGAFEGSVYVGYGQGFYSCRKRQCMYSASAGQAHSPFSPIASSALVFDLSSLGSHPIFADSLTLDVGQTVESLQPEVAFSTSTTSCTTTIYEGLRPIKQWKGQGEFAEPPWGGDPKAKVDSPKPGPEAVYDLPFVISTLPATVVKDFQLYLYYDPSKYVLKSVQPSHAYGCFTRYTREQLSVVYF